MRKALSIAAIFALIVTIAAAGAVLYGMNTLAPRAVSVNTVVTPAVQAQETFDALKAQLDDGVFMGRTFGDPSALEAEGSSFVTYTVRLDNRGFFPAEWISLIVTPAEGDILQLENGGANVLYAQAQGDLAVTLLTSAEPAQQPRQLEIACYVFGRKQTVFIEAT